MAIQTITYSKSADFPGGSLNTTKLAAEIAADPGVTIQLNRIGVDGDVVDLEFAATLPAGERTVLDADTTGPAGGLIAAHDNTSSPLVQEVNLANAGFSTAKHLKVETQPREGTGTNFYSPNLCDRTTWWENATEVSEFALTDSGDLTTWNTNGTHPGPWVDLAHGKLFNEDGISAANTGLLCVVEVSTDAGTTWAVKTEDSIDAADGDYSVDYAAGTVTFTSALNSGDQVRASFAKCSSTMTMTLKPATGKRIRLVHVETQISTDIGLTDAVHYEVWAYNPNDLPNKVKVKESIYKSISDFLYESTGVYPLFPMIDVNGPRGLPKDIIVVPFNYTASREILDSQGVEIRMTLATPFTGHLCTTTFYCLEESE